MKALGRLLLFVALLASNVPFVQAATTPPPTCKLFASASSVASNTRVRLDWSSTNATSGYLLNAGPVPAQGSTYVVPGKTTTYTASFTGAGGSVVCRVAVSVNGSNPVGGGGSINTNIPVDLNQPVNLTSPNLTFPTVQTPTATQSGSFLSGIVPAECRGNSTVANCDLCSLAQLVQNSANFALGLTIPAGAILFAIAGAMFFSSRGIPDKINQAKKIFKTVVIGFVLAVSAWTLINVIMNGLIHGASFQSWNWKSLNCTATRILRQQQINKTLADYLASSLPGLTNYQAPTGSAYECKSGDAMLNGNCVSPTGTVTEPILVKNANNPKDLGCSQYGDGYMVVGTQCFANDSIVPLEGQVPVGPALRAGQLTDNQQDILQDACEDDKDMAACSRLNAALGSDSTRGVSGIVQWNSQIANACNSAGTSDCRIVQAIMANESAGNCNQISKSGAVGCMQLMPTTACGIDSSIAGCSTCTNWNDNKGPACSTVVQSLLSDPTRNINTGTQMLTRLETKYDGDVSKIAAAYNGGDKANNFSSVCGSGTAWQCTQNSGYAETRNYVTKVSNTLNILKK